MKLRPPRTACLLEVEVRARRAALPVEERRRVANIMVEKAGSLGICGFDSQLTVVGD